MKLYQQVWISPKAKRVHLQRFLLSKLVFFRHEFVLRDLCCLFENQLWLEQKCLSDPVFSQKFGKSLEVLSKNLKEINFKTRKTDRAIVRLSEKLKTQVPELILPKRNYYDAKSRTNGLFQLQDPKPYGIASKMATPTARIGKGYRDKGSARDLAKDGSPSWQEVASHQGPIYHKGNLTNESQDNRPTERSFREIFERVEGLREEKSRNP